MLALCTAPTETQASAALNLRQMALQAILCTDFEEKYTTATVLKEFVATFLGAPTDQLERLIGASEVLVSSTEVPGRPTKPELVHPSRVPKRSIHTREGRAALIHSIAHIEFNAINLALDAIWRFAHMPVQYYLDWTKVAAEEAKHFGLLRDLLRRMGYDYGDFPAHDGLWEMTEKTKDDITARMALVPRTLEARGLDATPLIQAKLHSFIAQAQRHSVRARQTDPHALADCEAFLNILDVILADEIGHVAIGNHWYRWLCERQALDTVTHYATLSERYNAPKLKAPFNVQARLSAGFGEVEIQALHEQATSP
jgi:uncharacterized ferritin-like protein (DUF455 family)